MQTAILLIGTYRTFDKTYALISKNIIEPNQAKVFVFCDTEMSTEELTSKLHSKLGANCIAKVATVPNSKNEVEYKNILDFLIRTSPALSTEAFANATRKDPYHWDVSFLHTSGNVVQYYQFLKCFDLMLEYEKEHQMRFDVCMRYRFDVVTGMELNFNRFFIEAQENKNNIFLKSLGSPFLMENFRQKRIARNACYDLLDPEKQIDVNNCIWSLGIDQIWMGKRDLFSYLRTMIYEFGKYINPNHHCTFNSETFFTYHLKHLGIDQVLLMINGDDHKMFNDSFIHREGVIKQEEIDTVFAMIR